MAGAEMPKWMWEMIGEYPYAPAPDGVIPNYENPELKGWHSITIACGICIGLLGIFSMMRFYAKWKVIGNMTVDDYLFLISLPMLICILSLYIYLDNAGTYGYHAWDLKVKDLSKPILVITFIHVILLPITTFLIKATLLTLILTAFRPVKWLRALCYGGLVSIFCYYFANFVIVTKACRPREGTDRTSFLMGMASPDCADSYGLVIKASIATGVFNVISDFFILIIPLPAVKQLKIPKKRKMGVYGIFSAGGMACIASILSLVFRVRLYGSHDVTVDDVPPMSTNMVELSVGLICTCIAPVAKLARYIVATHFPSMLGTSTSQRSDPYQGLGAPMVKKKKHHPGGLSELDSMKTFGTTWNGGTMKTIEESVTESKASDSTSTRSLTA